MARMRVKGKTIPVQLPLSLDAKLRKIATQQGLSPGQWLSWFLTNKLRELPDPE
jgi:hypothetical protein